MQYAVLLLQSAFLHSNLQQGENKRTGFLQEQFLNVAQTTSLYVLCWFSHVRLFGTPMDSSPQVSSVRGILQARTLEWVAMPSSGSLWPIDWTRVFYVSFIGRRDFYHSLHLGSPSLHFLDQILDLWSHLAARKPGRCFSFGKPWGWIANVQSFYFLRERERKWGNLPQMPHLCFFSIK